MHLTYDTPKSRLRDNIANVEITPEMLEAGLIEWGKGDLRFDEPQEIVERIFRAMLAYSNFEAIH